MLTVFLITLVCDGIDKADIKTGSEQKNIHHHGGVSAHKQVVFGEHARLSVFKQLSNGLQAPSSHRTGKRLLTIDDIIATRWISDLAISPGGNKVAYLVNQKSLASNDERSELFLIDMAASTQSRKLADGRAISHIAWSPDAKLITYLAPANTVPGTDDKLWQIDPTAPTPKTLLDTAGSIAEYRWSPDAKVIAFVKSRSEKDTGLVASGIVYGVDSPLDSFDSIQTGRFRGRSELWTCVVEGHICEKSWTNGGSISEISWAPDGKRIAFAFSPTPRIHPNDQHIGFVSLGARDQFSALVSWRGLSEQPTWSPDGSEIAFLSEGDMSGVAPYIYDLGVFTAKIADNSTRKVADLKTFRATLWWSSVPDKLLLEIRRREGTGLYELNISNGNMGGLFKARGSASRFSFDAHGNSAACIMEDLMVPPEIAVMNVDSGRAHVLTDLNPVYRDIRLGDVSELALDNKYGYQTTNWLIKPLDYQPATRYPLLLIYYGFDRSFISQAEWIPNYPAQLFAANGFVVLLMNCPVYQKWKSGDSRAALFNEVTNPLATVEAAVHELVTRGIADPMRIGIMGWSMGGHFVNEAVTRMDLFAAASSGEAARRDPGAYWSEGEAFQELLDSAMGGPPLPEWYNTWKEFSPSLRVPSKRTPVMIEYQAKTPEGMEVFGSWRKQGAPVELVLYPNEGHIFSEPVHQFYSMERNLDWFRFWLKAEEDPDNRKAEQYSRWHELRRMVKSGRQ